MIATKIGDLLDSPNPVWLAYYLRFLSTRKRNERFENSHRHHIVPRCLFTEEDDFENSEENLTYLTHREHFIAHLLLHKICSSHRGLLSAVILMSGKAKISSRVYESLMKKVSDLNTAYYKDPANLQKHIDSHNTPEAKANMSRAQKLYKNSPEGKRKNSLSKLKKYEDPVFKKKFIESQNTPETSERRKAASKELWSREGFRENFIEKMNSEEVRSKLSETSKELWKDEQYRKKVSEKIKESHSTEEYKEKASKAIKKSYEENPERREACRESTTALFKNKEYQKKHKASHNTPEYKALVKAYYENPEVKEKNRLSCIKYANSPKGRMTQAKSVVSRTTNLLAKDPSNPKLLERLDRAVKTLQEKTYLYEMSLKGEPI